MERPRACVGGVGPANIRGKSEVAQPAAGGKFSCPRTCRCMKCTRGPGCACGGDDRPLSYSRGGAAPGLCSRLVSRMRVPTDYGDPFYGQGDIRGTDTRAHRRAMEPQDLHDLVDYLFPPLVFVFFFFFFLFFFFFYTSPPISE